MAVETGFDGAKDDSWVTINYLRLEYLSYRTFRIPHLGTANWTAYDGHVASMPRAYYQLGLGGMDNTQIAAALPFQF